MALMLRWNGLIGGKLRCSTIVVIKSPTSALKGFNTEAILYWDVSFSAEVAEWHNIWAWLGCFLNRVATT